jgi:hypothetical protein
MVARSGLVGSDKQTSQIILKGDTMKNYRFIFALSVIGVMPATVALAESYKFQLHNESQYEITGFQTFEDGKWSTWSGVSVPSGDTQTMNWNSNEGDCTVPFRIMYKDIETEQYKVDWCKIRNIRVHDDSVTTA